jgi:putative DNA primase/helicase
MAAGFVPDPSLPSILELAIMLWGQPTGWSHDRNEARFGAKESKSVLLKELVWRDHEAGIGGGYLAMHKLALGALPEARTLGGGAAKANGHTAPGKAANGHAGKVPPWQNIGKRYGYLDAAGHLVLEVVRTLTGSPRFLQRRPDPTNRSGWKWSLKDIPRDARPLYRLPELLASGSETTWICEGEKDADNLTALGLIATTAIGGTGGGWRAAYNGYFAGKPVVILPDNDPPGRAHAAIVARALFGVASSVKVLALPGLPEKGDVTDWLADGGDRSELEWLALEAPPYVPPGTYSPGVAPSGGAGGGVDGEGVAGGGPGLDGDIAFAEAEAEIGEGGGETETEAGIGLGPEPPPPDDPGGRPRPGDPEGLPVIICEAGELSRMVRETEAALLNSGLPIYERGSLVQPHEREYLDADGNVTHSAGLASLTAPALALLMDRSARFMKWDARRRPPGFVKCDPPEKLVQIVLFNRAGWPFPVVRGVLTCPTLRSDGSLLTEAGYDPISRYYLMFPTDLTVPGIPETPSKAEAKDSLDRLSRLLDSYPFVSAASRSVALTMLMTQVLRCAMPNSPLLAVSAKAPGTGKSHLVNLASALAIGRPCPAMGAGRDEKETEKEINTMLLSGVPGFTIDNVSSDVDIPLLNRATSETHLSIRIFGKLESVEVENYVVIYMTGNNLAIVDEQGRRSMRCDMDAGVARPERRHFNADPIQTARADRGRYIADVLTIARAYHLSGEQVAPFPLAGFEKWSHFVREPLIWLGCADPCGTMEVAASDDPATMRLLAMVEGWHHEFRDIPTTVADVVAKSASDGFYQVLREHFGVRGGASIDTSRIGYWLRKYAGRVVNGKRFVRDQGVTNGTGRWYVEVIS